MARRPRDPEPEFRIDLHGLTLASALKRLEEAIYTCRARGGRRALVITGRGWGSPGQRPVLAPAVESWLKSDGARRLGVTSFRRAHRGGAFEVEISRPERSREG